MAKATHNLQVLGTVLESPNKFRLVEAFQGRATPVNEDDRLELALSMLRDGQQQPIQVRKVAGTDEFETVFGNTRVLAGLMIVNGVKGADGKDIIKPNPEFKLRAEIVEIDDKEAFRRNVIENAHRNQCTPIDNAINQERLRTEHGLKDGEIAKLYGYDQANVSRLKALLTLPKDIQNAVNNGSCATRAAVKLATAKDVVAAEAFDAVWMKLKDYDSDNPIRESDMAAAIREWQKEQSATVTPEGTQEGSTDGTQPAPEGSTDGTQPEGSTDGTQPAPETPTISLSYKVFKDVFREAVKSERIPSNTKNTCQMILDFADGKVESVEFMQYLMFAHGEELLPKSEETAPVPSPVPQQESTEQPSDTPQEAATEQPANGSGKKRKVTRK